VPSPYATPDHFLFIFGQSRADGWACRKEGCNWQTYNVQWEPEDAWADHNKKTGQKK